MTDIRWVCFFVASLIFALIGAAGWWWRDAPSSASDHSTAAVHQASRAAVNARVPFDAARANPTDVSAEPPADTPNSGPGFHPAQLFDIGFGGGLIVTADTRRAIESLLASMSADPSTEELERLRAALHEGLPFDDAKAVMKLLANYREYSTDMERWLPEMGAPQTLGEVDEYFKRIESIQRQHLGETTAAAFFEHEMLLARLSMQALLINHDPHLDGAHKLAQIEALRARLPVDQRNMLPPAADGGIVSAGSVAPAIRKAASAPNG